eukprot:SAG11_NODE_1409_length_4997_cov_4.521846_1_plen_35_part_00
MVHDNINKPARRAALIVVGYYKLNYLGTSTMVDY